VLVVTLVAPVYAQAPSISLADAKKMLAAAEAAAAKVPVALSCTVVDARADLVAMARMDGARYFTVNVSHGKARASAAFGGPSGGLTQLAGSGIGGAVGDPVFFLQGAVPLMKNKQLAGAIGCSGGTGQQDEDAAKAGAAAF
jgi:uncharacterized protein GlcG (DUF336 family)